MSWCSGDVLLVKAEKVWSMVCLAQMAPTKLTGGAGLNVVTLRCYLFPRFPREDAPLVPFLVELDL